MNYRMTDTFRNNLLLLLTLFTFAFANRRDKNVATNAVAYEVNDHNNLRNTSNEMIDGDRKTCASNATKEIYVKLDGIYVISRIGIYLDKEASFSNSDEAYIGVEANGRQGSLCNFGQGRHPFNEIRCFSQTLTGDFVRLTSKYIRMRICEIQIIVCEDGYFGTECKSECNCDNSESCDKSSGSCPNDLCAPGWEGPSCQKECQAGKFWNNCLKECHCAEGAKCDTRVGTCPGSRCIEGWYGSTCQTATPKIDSGLSLYTETESSLQVTWQCWGGVFDPELAISFIVFFKPSLRDKMADDDGNMDEHSNEKKESDPTVVSALVADGWSEGVEVNHMTGRTNYYGLVQGLQHNTFYEFLVVPKLTLPGSEVVYGKASLQSSPFRTKCKVPENPRLRNVTSFIDHLSRAVLSVQWEKLSANESNCEGILYYEIYYEDSSKPQQWSKATARSYDEMSNISNVLYDTGYTIKMCAINNQHLESCSDSMEWTTCEAPAPRYNFHSSTSAGQNAGIIIGIVLCFLVVVVVVSAVFIYRQTYLRKSTKFSESFYLRNESQIGLAKELSHSSELDDLISQIVIRPSSLNANNNDFDFRDSTAEKLRQLERSLNACVRTTSDLRCLSNPVAKDDFVSYVDGLKGENYLKLKLEFAEIPTENAEATKKVGQLPENIMRNRFKDVIAYDHTRVKLRNYDDADDTSDYINANYVDGLNKPKAYIATQGCKKNTIIDFWSMVWQEECRRIVMVTNLIERSSIKCHQYWPDREGATCHYGDLSVTFGDVIKTTYYTIRSLQVARYGTTREIKHFHFTAWPDQGVPSKINQMLTFRNKVRSCDATHPGVIVVHCSAGIGRTGAFMALDISLDQLAAESCADVMKTTATMRMQRCNLIQRVEQYIFVYLSLAEFLKVGNTSTTRSKFNTYYQTLRKMNRNKGRDMEHRNELEKQFEMLDGLTYPTTCTDEGCVALLPQNRDKNRYSAVVPNDKSRPYLTSVIEGTNDFINASYLDGYRWKNAYIITQMPLQATVIDFWRLVFEHDSRIIIMLNSFDVAGHQTCGQYWPEENEESECGPFLVQTLRVRREGNVCIRELELSCVAEVLMNSSLKSRYDSSPHQVTVFQMSSLEHEYFLSTSPKCKLSPSQFSEFFKSVGEDLSCLIESVDREESRVDVDLPIIVHCDDGQTLSGLFVAVSCIYEKVRVEGEVDVLQTVRNLREARRGVIPTLKQYQFCYEMASRFVNNV